MGGRGGVNGLDIGIDYRVENGAFCALLNCCENSCEAGDI